VAAEEVVLGAALLAERECDAGADEEEEIAGEDGPVEG